MKLNIVDKVVNRIPNYDFKGGRGERVFNWFGKNISTPQNRVIIGMTALATQPFIDLYNKDVDEKTRVVSCARTIAKIIVGTATGFLIRDGFIRLVRHNSVVGKGVKRSRQFFTPSLATSDKTHDYKQYQNTVGTILAILAMLVTNFAVDAPLTKILTNHLMKKFGVSNSEEQGSKGGSKV